jgi:hypothetical protein
VGPCALLQALSLWGKTCPHHLFKGRWRYNMRERDSGPREGLFAHRGARERSSLDQPAAKCSRRARVGLNRTC